MKLIFGLGNPGKQYQNTRHNLGQKIIKEFVFSTYNQNLSIKKNLDAEIFETGQGSQKIIFAISTGFMNNSGIPVKKVSQFYKIDPSDIYILHDDLDLGVGDLKIQYNRGPAGHNGIKSIIEHLNTQEFNRIRIGIAKPQIRDFIEDFVLQTFSSDELTIINNLIPRIFEEIKNIINS